MNLIKRFILNVSRKKKKKKKAKKKEFVPIQKRK